MSEQTEIHYMHFEDVTVCGVMVTEEWRVSFSWPHVTCGACLDVRHRPGAEQGRIARMLAECAEVRETAERQIAEYTEIRERALSVERRLHARADRLSTSQGVQDGAAVPGGPEDAPRAFLADLRQFAEAQRPTSKPMPY